MDTQSFQSGCSLSGAVLGAILGIVAAPHFSQGQAIHPELEEDAANLDTSELEQEIQALDPFVEWLIRSDYISPVSSGIISLQVHTEQDILNQWGSIKPTAWYQDVTDTIYLPTNESIDVVAHEISHALWDEVFVGTHMSRYSGPTQDEISDYTQRFITQEAFTPIRETIEQMCELYTLASTFKNIELKRKATEIRWRALKDYSGEHTFAFSQDIQEIEEAIAQRSIVPTFYDENSTKEFYESLSLAEKSLFYEVTMFDPSQEGWVQEQIRINRRHLTLIEQDNEEWEGIIQKIKRLYYELPFEYQLSFTGELLSTELTLERDSFKLEQDKHTICSMTSPNEVFARMVGGLYAVYLGEFTPNLYPLDEQDLKFLEQFKVDGEPLFKKGIERYRVGLLMQETGTNPQLIAEQLQQATYLIYNNVEYNWPASKFKISGEILRGE